jgi:hypothetical protein
MASTALTTIIDSDGNPLVRFLRRNIGHVSGYSHALLSFLSGIEIRNDREPDEKTYHGMGFLAPMLIAGVTRANGDTFLVSPNADAPADFRFAVYENGGEVFVRCEDAGGLIFETNATRA